MSNNKIQKQIKVSSSAPDELKRMFQGLYATNDRIVKLKTSKNGNSLAVIFTDNKISKILLLGPGGKPIKSRVILKDNDSEGGGSFQICQDAFQTCLDDCGGTPSDAATACDLGCEYEYLNCLIPISGSNDIILQ